MMTRYILLICTTLLMLPTPRAWAEATPQASRASAALLKITNHHPERVEIFVDTHRRLMLGPGESLTTSALPEGWVRLRATSAGSTIEQTRIRLRAGTLRTWAVGADDALEPTSLELINVADESLTACLGPDRCESLAPHSLLRIEEMQPGVRTIEVFTGATDEPVDVLIVELMPGDTYRWIITDDAVADDVVLVD